MKKVLKNEKGFVISSMIVILGVLLAVSLGSYVYYSSAKTVQNASSTLSEQEASVYNASLLPYIGTNMRGSNVKILIETIISFNSSYVGENGRFIALDASGVDSSTGLIGDAGTSLNTTEYVNEYNTKMRSVISKIETGKTYNVTASYDINGFINKIIIEEN